jgi:phage gpG-like protein
MAKRNSKKGKRFGGGLDDFLAAIEMLADGIEDPSFKQQIANYIARDAVKRAKENIYNGGNPTEPHSPDTPELTKKLRDGKTEAVLMETGKMEESVKVLYSTVYMNKVMVEIGIDNPAVAKYAEVQEYGAVVLDPVQAIIPPRPFLRPAIQDAVYESVSDSDLKFIIEQAIKEMANGGDWKSWFKVK